MTEAITLEALLANTGALPSLPTVALRIIQEIRKDQSSMEELAKIISYDPALTAKILKLANSSFYALPNKVDSIERAVGVLGLEALKNIALSFVIVRGFKKDSVDKFDHELFWKRSITAAVSAEMISKALGTPSEEMFVTPLLMDIGILVMYMSLPEEYQKVIDEKKVSEITTLEAERRAFGFDHQQVSSGVLKQWGLPESICQPIAYHHEIEKAPEELRKIAEVLYLADISSSVYHGSKTTRKFGTLSQTLQQKMKVSEEEASVFIDAIAEKTVEILSSFEIDSGEMKPYSEILQQANEELGKLNISYEQLVMELKQEKTKVEKLAQELKKANSQLSDLASKDGLTGLFNHRFFQDLMDRELQRVERYERTMSLILIDIDHFKRINDTYGHPRGDTVLKTVAGVFEKTIRKPDVAMRYGGEEFAIVLPETELKGAVVLADRLRKLVEELSFTFNGKKLKVTISLGVTAYDPAKAKRSKADIIEAADKALYNSKETGRNRFSIAA